eukprot:4815882-Prymnesium_polylepis.1
MTRIRYHRCRARGRVQRHRHRQTGVSKKTTPGSPGRNVLGRQSTSFGSTATREQRGAPQKVKRRRGT